MKNHTTSSHLVAFLYELMRDHVALGDVEGIVGRDEHTDVTKEYVLTNGYLAEYAEDVAKRLTRAPDGVKQTERDDKHALIFRATNTGTYALDFGFEDSRILGVLRHEGSNLAELVDLCSLRERDKVYVRLRNSAQVSGFDVYPCVVIKNPY